MRAIEVQEYGGPEVLVLRDVADPVPIEGEVLIDVSAAGVNFADTHKSENAYFEPTPLPFVPGGEVAGTTSDGQRVVAFAEGAYAEKAVAPAPLVFPIPDALNDDVALALMVQGVTAWHLLRTSAQIRDRESVVVHAAAGGVGTIAVQLARRFGAGRVIAVASTPEKRALAERLGADATLDSGSSDLAAGLRAANEGRRVDIVLEMVGGKTFVESLKALAPFGRLVVYGQAGREGTPRVDPGGLMAGSRGVLGFWLVHLLRRPDMLREAVNELFDAAASGEIEVVVGGSYPLGDARRAHEDLLARRTSGKVVLVP
jgi:NADPH2:quinone reductase